MVGRRGVHRDKRDNLAAAIVRVGDILERGRWPSGMHLTPRERVGLQRTLDAMRADLRRIQVEA